MNTTSFSTAAPPASVRETVRQRYGWLAMPGNTSSCCGAPGDGPTAAPPDATRLGYPAEAAAAVPEGADLGLGCGNPVSLASLQPGDVVLDLGSGAGFDCFLAAGAVGPTGRVIGVDMTPEMLAKAQGNAARSGIANVEFRLGEIEALPVADMSVDAVISNCVLNLSPEKERVAREAFRVLKPGGRLAVSDLVRLGDLPAGWAESPELYCACAAGAASVSEWERWLSAAGFVEIAIRPKDESREFIRDWAPGVGIENHVLSATIEARRPADASAPR